MMNPNPELYLEKKDRAAMTSKLYLALAVVVVGAAMTVVWFAGEANLKIRAKNEATIAAWEAAGCKVTSFVKVAHGDVRRVYTCADGTARMEPR
jgi:uncharacterized membrane protein YqiK